MILVNSFQQKYFFEKLNLTLEKPKYLDLIFSVFRLIFQDVTHLIWFILWENATHKNRVDLPRDLVSEINHYLENFYSVLVTGTWFDTIITNMMIFNARLIFLKELEKTAFSFLPVIVKWHLKIVLFVDNFFIIHRIEIIFMSYMMV